jgi:hypothetical protein
VGLGLARQATDMFQIFICDPWESYMTHLETTCRQAQIEHDLELDLEREAELNPPTEETDIQYLDAVFCADFGDEHEAISGCGEGSTEEWYP